MQYTSDQRTMNPDKNMYHLTTVTEERPTVPKITKTNENLITFSSSYERGKDTKRKSIILNTPVKKIQSETLSITTTFHVKDLSSIKADSNILDDLARLKVHLLTPVVHSIPVDINIKTSSYILYLEPQKNTSLYESIVRFYNSSSKFGYNEAHQYHPHCSMTGFFDLPNLSTATNTQNLSFNFVEQSINALNEIILSYTSNRDKGPIVHPIQEPKINDDKLRIEIDVPSEWKSISQTFKSVLECLFLLNTDNSKAYSKILELKNSNIDQRIKKFLNTLEDIEPVVLSEEQKCFLNSHVPFIIRPKLMDHISLAYLDKFVSSSIISNRDSASIVKIGLDPYLVKQIYEHGKKEVDSISNESHKWSIVFYQVDCRSDILGIPHRFTELKRWNI